MRYVVLIFLLSAVSLFCQQPNEIWNTHESRVGKTTYVIDDGDYFFSANDVNGVIRYKKNSQDFVEMFDMGGIHAPRINYLAKDSLGVIWAAGDKGIFRWDGKEWNYIDFSNKIENFIRKIDKIYIDKRGKIWMLGLSDDAHDQIGYYYNDTTFWFDNNRVPERFLIEDVAFDSVGNFWAVANTVEAKNSKLIKISPSNQFAFWDSTNGLNPKDLGPYFSICTDKAQNIWFAGNEIIYRMSPNRQIVRFHVLNKYSTSAKDSLHYMSKCIKSFGNIIYAFGDDGYSMWDGTKWINRQLDVSNGDIVEVEEYGDSNYVVLTRNNLFILNKYTNSFEPFPVKTNFIFDYVNKTCDYTKLDLKYLSIGNAKALYLVNHIFGIEGFSDNKWTSYQNNKQLPKVRVGNRCSNGKDVWFAINELTIGDDYQYVGYNYGALRYNGETWQIYNKYNSPMLSDSVSAITNDDKDNMWFGYKYKRDSASVSKFDGQNWKHYSFKVPEGLEKGSVNSIYQDFLGDMWFLVTYYVKDRYGENSSQDKSTYLYQLKPDESVTTIAPWVTFLGESYQNNNNTMVMTSDSTLWIATMPVYSSTATSRAKWGLYSLKDAVMKAYTPGQNSKHVYSGCSISSLTEVDGEIWCGLMGTYSYAWDVGGIGRYRRDGNFSTDWIYDTEFYADIIDERCISKYDSVVIYSVNDMSRMNDSTIMLSISYQTKNSKDFYNKQALAFIVNGRLIIRNDISTAKNFIVADDGSLWGGIIKGRYADEQFVQISHINYLSVEEIADIIKEESSLVIYPNPAKDRVMILHPRVATVSFNLYDINANAVELPAPERINETTYMLDVSALQSGTYIVVGDDGKHGKFVVKR